MQFGSNHDFDGMREKTTGTKCNMNRMSRLGGEAQREISTE